jgi:hypothetical protein
MSIRSALGGLPSWPALVIAPLIVLGVGILHYGPAYRQCSALAEAREGLSAAAARAAAGGAALRLEAVVAAGDWDQVRIVAAPPSGEGLLDCPFGWDLDRGERRAMIAAGRLGLLVFAKEGQASDYREYRRDRIDFMDTGRVLARAEAVFEVEAAAGGAGYVLRRAGAAP